MSTLSDATAAAQKALGKDGKIPKPKVDTATLRTNFDKAADAFDKSRADLESKLLDLENVCSQIKNTLKQYADIIDGNSFGLDASNEDNKKKIDTASDLLLKAIKESQDNMDTNLDRLSKLDRVVTDLRRLSDMKCQ